MIPGRFLSSLLLALSCGTEPLEPIERPPHDGGTTSPDVDTSAAPIWAVDIVARGAELAGGVELGDSGAIELVAPPYDADMIDSLHAVDGGSWVLQVSTWTPPCRAARLLVAALRGENLSFCEGVGWD